MRAVWKITTKSSRVLWDLLDTLTRSRMYESVLAAFDFVARSLLRLSQLHAWCLRGEVSLVSFTPRALYSLVTRDSHRDSDS